MTSIGPLAGVRGTAPATANPQREDTVRALDPARADKLRSAIEGGRYPLDSAKLAERLITLGLVSGRAR